MGCNSLGHFYSLMTAFVQHDLFKNAYQTPWKAETLSPSKSRTDLFPDQNNVDNASNVFPRRQKVGMIRRGFLSSVFHSGDTAPCVHTAHLDSHSHGPRGTSGAKGTDADMKLMLPVVS